MYLERYRDAFAFYTEENKVLKVVNFQPILRFSYSEYVADGRKYLGEIAKEYPEYTTLLSEEETREYYATQYAEQMWQRDCEVFGEECKAILEECNRKFLAMPKMERKKKLKRMEELFSRYRESWKFQFSDFDSLKEDYHYLLQWKEL